MNKLWLLVLSLLQHERRHGYEIGNHSLWHQNLAKASPEEVKKQLSLAQQAVAEFLPGYRLLSLALPFGAWPNSRELAQAGVYKGISYVNQAILLVGSGPAPSPADRDFDPLMLPRIQAGDGPWGVRATLARLHSQAYGRHVSDGNPSTLTVPLSLAGRLRREMRTRAVLIPDWRLVPAGTRD